MAMITNLSKTLCKKDDRFKLVYEGDNGYRVYSYTSPESGKVLNIDTERHDGVTYLAINVWRDGEDKVVDRPFTLDEWRDTAESELTGLFSGVEKFNVERLVCVCEKIIRGVDRLTEEVLAKPEPDMTPVVERLKVELELVDALIAEGKAMEWWRLHDWSKDYKLRDAANHLHFVMGDRKHIVEWTPSENRADNLEYLDKLERYGYIYFMEGGTHDKWLRESIEECKRLAEEEV